MTVAYSKAQSAVFAAPGNDPTLLTDVKWRTTNPLVNITQGTALTAPFFSRKLADTIIHGIQVQPSIGLTQLSTLAFGSNFKVADFVLRKTWNLVNVTGSGDAGLQFRWQMPIVTFSLRGWASGATDITQTGGTVTATLNVIGTAICTASGDTTCIVKSFDIGVPKRLGGPIPCSCTAQVSGLVTGTSTEFVSSVVDPPEATMSITNTGGPAPSSNALNYSITVNCNMSAGGPIIVNRSYRYSITN